MQVWGQVDLCRLFIDNGCFLRRCEGLNPKSVPFPKSLRDYHRSHFLSPKLLISFSFQHSSGLLVYRGAVPRLVKREEGVYGNRCHVLRYSLRSK